ncbi:hypothetical protein [Streptomyces sp. GESEQ-35]|uniref:hypothetical protein n=1 Tax=Streptomyces sp. GESEQ-35 TaxID=2812657 RepID=UPI001B342D37|nr:hypothetical protein [Streptomyces sp. GESEQ-35]
MTNLKAIKRRLRELRADPGAEGATGEAQRLIGELARARQARDVGDMERPASRRTAPRQEREDGGSGDHVIPSQDGMPAPEPTPPVMVGNDDVSGWPPELRARARRSSLSRSVTGEADDDLHGYGLKNDLKRISHWRW